MRKSFLSLIIALLGLSLFSCSENETKQIDPTTQAMLDRYSADSLRDAKINIELNHKVDSLNKFYQTPVGKIAKAKKDKEDKIAEEKKQTKAKQETEANKKSLFKELYSNGVQIYRHYDQNEVEADRIYNKQSVHFVGKVLRIGKVLGDCYIIICYDGNTFTGLQCTGNENEIANLSIGEMVEVHGECHGKTFSVMINNCHISKW